MPEFARAFRFSQGLVALEKFVTGDTISANPMINALVVGLGLGGICLVVTLAVLTGLFPGSSDDAEAEDEAAPVAKKTDGDNEPSAAKPKAATGESPVRRRVKATTD